MPGLPLAVVPHPLGGISEAEVLLKVDTRARRRGARADPGARRVRARRDAMTARGPAARTLEVDDDYPAINELYVERGWTDGLPIVPPTEGARGGVPAADRAAIGARSSRCCRRGRARPRSRSSPSTPSWRAAGRSTSRCCSPRSRRWREPPFNLDAVQATTHPVTPLLIVNGPIAKEIGLNGGYNAFGQGFRANVTIGRALRLVLMNVGGGLPGSGDRSTQGSPAKIAYCVAENEAENPVGAAVTSRRDSTGTRAR